jgi:hypothetical protein
MFSHVIHGFQLFHLGLGVACEAFETNTSYLKALLAAAFSDQLLLGLGVGEICGSGVAVTISVAKAFNIL